MRAQHQPGMHVMIFSKIILAKFRSKIFPVAIDREQLCRDFFLCVHADSFKAKEERPSLKSIDFQKNSCKGICMSFFFAWNNISGMYRYASPNLEADDLLHRPSCCHHLTQLSSFATDIYFRKHLCSYECAVYFKNWFRGIRNKYHRKQNIIL